MRWFDFLTAVILCAMLVTSIYFLYQYFPREEVEFNSYKAQVQNLPQQSVQFQPNMRYAESSLTFHLSDVCSEQKKKDFRNAAEIVEEKTILEFREIQSGKPDIKITCSNISPEPSQKGHFVAGEGGPALFLNTTRYAIILEGEIALYRPESCGKPNIALHELLHALGFDHNGNENSIMYPVTNCGQEFDAEIVEEINELYSEPSLPDAMIEEIEANKSGRYLNFNIVVTNQGLKNIESSILELSANGEIIKQFELDDIAVGAKRFLTVSNLRIPSKTEEIKFKVSTSQSEISKENNEAIITPSS